MLQANIIVVQCFKDSVVCNNVDKQATTAFLHLTIHGVNCFKFFTEVCNLTCPFDHIQTSEVCKTPYIPPGL